MAGRNLVLGPEQQRQLAVTLYQNGLFGINRDRADGFVLKSGRLAQHYLNIRNGLSDFGTRTHLVRTMTDLALMHSGQPKLGVDYIVGSPEGMTSYAASIADQLEMGLLQPRADMTKVTGNKSPILGAYTPGERVAAFDDVVTDGKTKVDTINSLGKSGLTVANYYVVLDREEGGAPQVTEATDVEITPALGVSTLTHILREEGLIDQMQFDHVARYLTQYGDPHAQVAMNSAF